MHRNLLAMALLGGRLRGVREVNLEGLEQHVLVIMEKAAATPAKFAAMIAGCSADAATIGASS